MRTLILCSLLFISTVSQAASLMAGYKNIGVKLGGSSIGSENYTVFGASINYFPIDHLSVGGAYEYWFSGHPSLSKMTIDTTYYIPASEKIRPYIGGIYSHYFIDHYSDVDAYGYRVGLAYLNDPVILSGGMRHEFYDNDSYIFDDSDTTVEFVVGFSF